MGYYTWSYLLNSAKASVFTKHIVPTVLCDDTEIWNRYKAIFLRECSMLEKAFKLSRPGPIRQKVFKPKNNLPRLADYSVDPPESYWDSWNKVTFSDIKHASWLDPKEFVNVAKETGYSCMNHINYIRDYLVQGA